MSTDEEQFKEIQTKCIIERGHLFELGLECFSKIDFEDVTDMLNYRRTTFTNAGGDDSIEKCRISNSPGNYEVNEIRQYIYSIMFEAIESFMSEFEADLQSEEPYERDEIIGEYFNHDSGLYVKVSKDSVEFVYIPVHTSASVEVLPPI
jgi:hypothetical protein